MFCFSDAHPITRVFGVNLTNVTNSPEGNTVGERLALELLSRLALAAAVGGRRAHGVGLVALALRRFVVLRSCGVGGSAAVAVLTASDGGRCCGGLLTGQASDLAAVGGRRCCGSCASYWR